ncbi:MAG: glycosyltransferase family 39 protein [Pseudomonadota bacterium]
MHQAETQAAGDARAGTVPPTLWVAAACLYVGLVAAKVYLGARLDLFGDGAFYWLESRHPAISYSDVPFLAPLMVGLGTALLGDTVLGARSLFIVVGSTLPFALYWMARPLVGHRDAVIAAIFSLLIPVPGTLGLLVIPDVPLLILSVLTLGALERATRTGMLSWWVLTGIFAACAFNAHYRFVFFALAAFLYLILTPGGRAQWRHRGLYIATAIAALGLVPVLWFNLSNRLAGVAFHFVGRHPWQFDPEGLVYLLTQLVWVTPLIFLTVAVTLWHLIQQARSGDDRSALMVAFPVAYLVPFVVLSPWAVGGNSTTAHWSLFAYMPLLVYVAPTLRQLSQRFGRWTWLVPASGAMFMALTVASVTLTAHYPTISETARRFATDKMSGWPDVGAAMEARLAAHPELAEGLVVADNYYLATQLAHTTKRTSGLYNLDNHKIYRHGRAVQRAIWGFGERGLRTDHVGKQALVVFEIAGARPARFCRVFETLTPIDTFELFEGERRYRFFIGGPIRPMDAPKPSGDCVQEGPATG